MRLRLQELHFGFKNWEGEMETEGYRYAGVPLTATIASDLAFELYSGRVLERRTIGEGVIAEHLRRGGVAARGGFEPIIRHALRMLRERGAAINVSPGHWSIGQRVFQPAIDDVEPVELEISDPVEGELLPSDVMELGDGSEAVYLYFLPTYKLHAELSGRLSWPCKIGRTAGDPLQRIAMQAATALPESPRMAAVVWTADSASWEKAIHGVLAARGKRLKNALGVEWFETSPDEFVEIAKWIEPALHSD